MGKGLSVMVAIAESLWFFDNYPEHILLMGVYLFCSLALVWFGNYLGRYVNIGMLGRGDVSMDSESPGWAVKLLGWIMLFVPISLVGLYYMLAPETLVFSGWF